MPNRDREKASRPRRGAIEKVVAMVVAMAHNLHKLNSKSDGLAGIKNHVELNYGLCYIGRLS